MIIKTMGLIKFIAPKLTQDDYYFRKILGTMWDNPNQKTIRSVSPLPGFYDRSLKYIIIDSGSNNYSVDFYGELEGEMSAFLEQLEQYLKYLLTQRYLKFSDGFFKIQTTDEIATLYLYDSVNKRWHRKDVNFLR